MRKKGISILFIAGITLAIIFTGGFIVRIYLQKTSNELITKLDIIYHYVDSGSWDEACLEVKQLNEVWEKKEKVWGMIINHHEIDNISVSLKASQVYISQSDQSDSLASLSSLRHYISHIPVMEKLSPKNIL